MAFPTPFTDLGEPPVFGFAFALPVNFFRSFETQSFPFPDDPEAGGPGPTGGSEADGPETGGFAAGVPASVGGAVFSPGLCFFGGGLGADEDDELEDEEEDALR